MTRPTDLMQRAVALVLIATAVPIIRALGWWDDRAGRGEDDA